MRHPDRSGATHSYSGNKHARSPARCTVEPRGSASTTNGSLAEHSAEELTQGLLRRKQAKTSWQPRIVMSESEIATPSTSAAAAADPSTVRPRLAEAATESLDEISRVLLEAATGATKQQWADFECDCGRRKRVQVPVPDVRARVAAIELLLREGLGRPPQAEEQPTPRIPGSRERSRRCPGQKCKRSPDALREHEAV
jgi:hypothetical protein